MDDRTAFLVIDGIIIVLLIAGIGLFRTPPGARRGTLLATLAMLAAIAAVLVRIDVHWVELIAVALLLGAFVGLWVAVRVNMIQIPAMIAFQHGAGGMAAFLVSFVELWRGSAAVIGTLPEVSGLIGLLIGAGTFSASLIASAKLANLLPSKPTVLRGHSGILLVLVLAAIALAVVAGFASGARLVILLARHPASWWAWACSCRCGWWRRHAVLNFHASSTPRLVSPPLGSGIILESYLLVVAGATVAASGSVLTHASCARP